MNNDNFILEELTEIIINSFYNIYNNWGYGYTKNFYEYFLYNELLSYNITIKREKQLIAFYEGKKSNLFCVDLLIENSIVIKIDIQENNSIIKNKAFSSIINFNNQEIEIGLLLNFGIKAEFKQIYFQNTLASNKNKFSKILSNQTK